MRIIEGKNVYTIAEVNSIAKESLEYLTFWVEGEIASYQRHQKWYNSFFTLKDDLANLQCYFDPNTLVLGEELIGKRVLIFGRLTLFRNTEYKMRVFTITEVGDGVMQKQFEELYTRLKSEGLFDEKNKKPLPDYPKKICLVASRGSAAWNDFKKHTDEKFPILDLTTFDVRVEGKRAVSELLATLKKVDKLQFDVIAITRGGGQEETLLEVFNNEQLARCIFSLQTPTVVAIGHEINITLAELVADAKASTPTDAANILTYHYRVLLEKLDHTEDKLTSYANYLFSTHHQRLDGIFQNLIFAKEKFKELPHRVASANLVLRQVTKQLTGDAQTKITNLFASIKREIKVIQFDMAKNLQNLGRSLILLSPENTLSRGYSITFGPNGRIIKNADSTVVGETIRVKLKKGQILSKVVTKQKDVQKWQKTLISQKP